MKVSGRLRRCTASFVLATTVLACPVFGQPAGGKVARVLDIDGKILMTNRRTDGRWFQAYEGMKSYLTERLRTDANTQAALEFDIGGRAGISPNTEIEIVGQREIDIVGNKVVVKSGKIWAKIDRQKSQLQIQTSGGVIGIEGTELLVAVEEGGTSELLLFEGQASITDNDGNKKTLFPGDYAEFGGGGGMCVLSYPSNGLRSLVVERFPEFSSFLAARGITTVPKGAITGPSLRPVPDFDELLQASEQNLVQDPQGLTPSKQTLALGQPTLSWPAVHGADSYLVLLAGDEQRREVEHPAVGCVGDLCFQECAFRNGRGALRESATDIKPADPRGCANSQKAQHTAPR